VFYGVNPGGAIYWDFLIQGGGKRGQKTNIWPTDILLEPKKRVDRMVIAY
jgi:hypothetical protein